MVRLLVRQAATSRDALVRFTVEIERSHSLPSLPERIWFLLDKWERQAAVQQQLTLLDRGFSQAAATKSSASPIPSTDPAVAAVI